MIKRSSDSTPTTNPPQETVRLRLAPIPDRVFMWSVWLIDQAAGLIGVIRLVEDGHFEWHHRGRSQDHATNGFQRRGALPTDHRQLERLIDESPRRATRALCDAVRRAV
jgi:hypothetical protein